MLAVLYVRVVVPVHMLISWILGKQAVRLRGWWTWFGIDSQ